MYEIPTPMTLEEIISLGGIEGSEEAYEDDHGFAYSVMGTDHLYYGGDEFDGGKPFTGLYYELYPDGKLESYATYQDGMPTGGLFSFHQNGKIKSYSYFSEGRLNDYYYVYDEEGKMIRANIWENGKLRRETFK